MKRSAILLAALLAASGAAFADEAEQQTERHIVIAGHGMDGMQLAAAATPAVPAMPAMPALPDMPNFDGMALHMHAKVVKNAPYSAEMISERVQNLADGNQIASKTSTMAYRDSAGRTRQEVRGPKGEVRRITIHDPAESVTYILDPNAKTASKLVLDKDIGRLAAEKARAKIEQMKKDGKLTVTEQDGDGHEVIVKRIERLDDEVGKRVREHVQIRVAQAMNAKADALAHVAPMIANAFGDARWSRKGSSKDLGSREFDGVKADGKMRSYEIPAGEIGNKNPISVSSETWYSPELQITVYSKQSDPRTGDRVYRLGSLKREEPAAALFTVPSDYTVRDMMAKFRKTIVEKK